MTKRDSRIMSRLETRRGFVPLEDCRLLGCLGYDPSRLTRSKFVLAVLVKYPEIGLQHFPPQQEVYLPPECLSQCLSLSMRSARADGPPLAQSCAASLSTPSRCGSKICHRIIAVRQWRQWRPCSSNDHRRSGDVRA